MSQTTRLLPVETPEPVERTYFDDPVAAVDRLTELYARATGWLKTPARLLQAAAPLIFGTALSVWGLGALCVTAGIGALATRALQAIKRA